ncbi:MAG: glycosyltransferase family 2 protein [Pseudomonadota bacterium]
MSNSKTSNLNLSIVVPFFNEEENVEPVYQSLMETLSTLDSTFEIIFVNDGSTDATFAKMQGLPSSHLKLINLRRNAGQTAAMMAGIDHARGEIIIPMDGDGQNDPKDIPLLLAKIAEGYDVVSGWRKNRQDRTITRKLPSIIANKIISYISGVKLRDYGCSLKAYKKDVIKGVKLYGEMHRFVPIYASWMGGKITEIPVRHHARTRGKSKYGLNRTFKVVLDLILVKFLDRYLTKPIHLFGGLGFLSMLLGTIFALYAFYLKIFVGTSFILTPLPLLTALCFLTGITSILMGLLAELVVRTYFESQNKDIYLIDGQNQEAVNDQVTSTQAANN